MATEKFEYKYAFIATNGRSTGADGTTYWLTSKNGRYDILDFLDEGWEPVRETAPAFSRQQVYQHGDQTQEQYVGVSLVVLRRPRRKKQAKSYDEFEQFDTAQEL